MDTNMIKVTMSKERYINLLVAYEELDMLEAGGVDNWSGFDDAMFPTDSEDYGTMFKRINKEVTDKYGS